MLRLPSHSEEELQNEPGSPIDGNIRDGSPDLTRYESAGQELSEESTYRETIRGVRSFMGWHQIPEFDSVFCILQSLCRESLCQVAGRRLAV